MLILAAVVALLILGLFWRFTVSPWAARSNRARSMRWRIWLRLRPGKGHASIAELAVRWSLLAALFHGRRARPDMTLRARIVAPTTDYAVRLGRAQYGKRVLARMEDQTLILAPPRTFKTGYLADRILVHPGAVLCTSTRTDLYDATAPERALLGLDRGIQPAGRRLPAEFVRLEPADRLRAARDRRAARRVADRGSDRRRYGFLAAESNRCPGRPAARRGPHGRGDNGRCLRVGQPARRCDG